MRHEQGFRALVPMFRAGGGVAVVSNGAPLWLQDSAWPRSPNGHAPSGIVRKADGSCQGQTMRQSGGESGSRAMPWSVNRDP